MSEMDPPSNLHDGFDQSDPSFIESKRPSVPDHQLIRCIGKGSYGEVWLARNAFGTFRAIKVVRRSSFDAFKPYEREFNGIQTFEPISRSHPSQIEILHVGINQEDEYFYYVMELADDESDHSARPSSIQEEPSSTDTQFSQSDNNILPTTYQAKTLQSLLRQKDRLPVQECLRISIALAEALEHLHSNGLVHRDIKPSNVIFVNGRPKLADIGLVARSDSTLSFVGTEGYLPPEGPGKAQADIYGLGKVMYEMLTGKDRKQFPEPSTMLSQSGDRKTINELNEVILKAADHSPERRYQNAKTLLEDLQMVAGGKSVRRRNLLHRSLVIVLKTIVVMTVLLVAGFLTSTWFKPSHEPSRLFKEAVSIPLNIPKGDLRLGVHWRLHDISPQGDQIIFLDENGQLLLYENEQIRSLFTEQTQAWTCSSPTWADDGERIAMIGVTRNAGSSRISASILYGRITDETLTELPIKIPGRYRALDWLPDGSGFSISTLAPHRTVDVHWDSTFKQWPENLFTGPDFEYSPDGRWRASQSEKNIWISRVSDGKPVQLTHHHYPEMHPTWVNHDTILFVRNEAHQEGQKSRLMQLKIDSDTGSPKGSIIPSTLMQWSQIYHPRVIKNGKKVMFFEVTGFNWMEVANTSEMNQVKRLGRGDSPRLSADGDQVFFIDRTPDMEGIYVRPTDGSGSSQLIIHAAGMVDKGFDISSDNKRLVLVHTDVSGRVLVKLVDIEQNSSKTIFTSEQPFTDLGDLMPKWSPNDNLIALVHQSNELLMFNGDTGNLQEHILLPDTNYAYPAWSPSGTHMAFILFTMDGLNDLRYRIEVLDIANKTWRQITPGFLDSPIEQVQWHPDAKRNQIQYYSYEYPEVHRTVSLNQQKVEQLMPGLGKSSDWLGFWAPDGRNFWYVGAGGITVLDVQTQQIAIMDHMSGLPTWNQTGSNMVWNQKESRIELKVMDLDLN